MLAAPTLEARIGTVECSLSFHALRLVIKQFSRVGTVLLTLNRFTTLSKGTVRLCGDELDLFSSQPLYETAFLVLPRKGTIRL